MRSLTEMVEEIIVIRTNAKYTFMSPEAVAVLIQTQALERVAAALEARPVLSQDHIVKALDAEPPAAWPERAVANQRTTIPSFTAPQGQGKNRR